MGKRFAFVSDAAEREYKDLPDKIQDEFGKDLRRIQMSEEPRLSITHLDSVGQGVIELKKNGSPAFRCIYVAKYLDTVFVLHSFIKTTNGVDRQAIKVAEQRYKELLAALKKLKSAE
ncbi:MAG: type II toxin-antitoxin system RelE/ParE family toxin [Methylococcaceae bacterium]|nr:type II toxin-antitoxin system RelE/ParE family toxin [Methylococcaceae bacterium]MDD1615530.1 type II toxin-antitoxin system RelE/ParE family toxin [Methylococcaceae bacterium]